MVMAMTKRSGALLPHKCPVCGKEFYPAAEHRYKRDGKMICSWKCLCKDREGKITYNTLGCKSQIK